MNLSCVHLPVSFRLVYSIYSLGMPIFRMLCVSLAGEAFRNTPITSRNNTPTTLLALHASLIYEANVCMESVVVWPALPLKWCSGKSLYFSTIQLSLFATHEERILDMTLSSAIGR